MVSATRIRVTTTMMIVVNTIIASFSIRNSWAFSSTMVKSPSQTLFLSSPTNSGTTLNEDGDFILEGINDGSSSTLRNMSPITSLLDLEYITANNKNSVTSNEKKKNSEPFVGSSKQVHIDENGDFQLKHSSPTTTTRATLIGEESSSFESNNLLSLTTLRSSSQDATLLNAATVSSPMSSTEDSTTSRSPSEVFLESIWPNNLSESDFQRYKKGLDEIGFDPDCASSTYLLFDDLGFMKKLHQRYFWEEWKKLLSADY
eukprot:scaffold2784_cov109-Cylindrotheca_fusiformis.AAC.2